MSLLSPRRSFLRSIVGLVAVPFAGRARASGPARFTADGQPIPAENLVSHIAVGVVRVTAIYRKWHKGAEKECRLCETCRAKNGSCLVTVTGYVPKEEAGLYSTVGHINLSCRPQNPSGPCRDR